MHSRLFLTVIILSLISFCNSELQKKIRMNDQPDVPINSGVIKHYFCLNWMNQTEVPMGECTCFNEMSLLCYGNPNFTAFDRRTINKYCNSSSTKRHGPGKMRQIIICGWPNKTFDLSTLTKFQGIRAIRFEYGALQNFDSEFPELKHLKHIRIRYTQLTRIQPSVFKHLPTISMIDLRWNQLDHYDGTISLPKRVQLYLSENPYNCSKNFKWLMNHSKMKHILDRNALQCGDNLFKNQSIQTVMKIKISLREMCQNNEELRNCTCILSYIALDLDGVRRPMYSINCSHLNLYRLPASVPENTTIFYAQHNKISEVEPLLSAYRNVHDIHLDYNQISTIETLETENWLEHFRAFSLKGNHMTRLPVYLLNNALEKNTQASAVYLSENPWRCECNFMLRFQELLQRHRAIIKDASEIQCINNDGGETMTYSVLALKRTDVCIMSTEYAIHPIDMLNGVLATLLIFVLVKLSYDYYNFRAYGHLPWIVTKMP